MDDPMDIDSDFYGNQIPNPTVQEHPSESDTLTVPPGDEETITTLNARVSSFNPPTSPRSYGLIPKCPKHIPSAQSTGHLHNPYAGEPYAWQLTETVEAFLKRVPPSDTPYKFTNEGAYDWIWITNPFIPPSPRPTIPGSAVEGPLPSNARVELFIQGGMERLHLFTDFMAHANASKKPSHLIAREITKERNAVVEQILALAQHLHVRSGKWMLFPEPGDVNEVWGVVARYTARNELGIAAKVATKVDDHPEKARLICVYTRDFGDGDDIARVLVRMRELDLVRVGKAIYYKSGELLWYGEGPGMGY